MGSNKKEVPRAEIETEFSNIRRTEFPDHFVFGTATSAYQVEGGAAKGGRGLSVWDAFTLRTPGKIADGSNGNEGVDMYTRYKEDIKMMKNMGFDAYRFSISWSRILPGGKLSLGVNSEGIDYYNDLINTLLANGIEPYVTLFHWDLPFTLEQEYGGFLSKDVVNDFRDYAELCFWEFGDRVKHWITLNEPSTYATCGYAGCTFPPGKPDPNLKCNDPKSDSDSETDSDSDTDSDLDSTCKKAPKAGSKPRPGYNFIPYRGFRGVKTHRDLINYGAVDQRTMNLMSKSSDDPHKFVSDYVTNQAKDIYIVARNMLLAHAAAVETYRANFKAQQKGKIGITLVTHWFEQYSDEQNDIDAATRAMDFVLGWYLQPVLIGSYPTNMVNYVKENLATFTDEETKLLQGSIDFLGLNYYTAYYVQDDPETDVIVGYNKDMHLKLHNYNEDGKRIGPPSGAKWLNIVPSGIYNLLKYIDKTYCTYKLPDIYITENGLADLKDYKLTASEACRDKLRVHYYQDHLGNVLKSMNEGVKVKGYFAWSWCDNFEWADGYTYRFGMIYIDYVNHLKRFPKDSAMWFAKFLKKKKKHIKKKEDKENM